MSRAKPILGLFLPWCMGNYRSTQAQGTFTHLKFFHSLELGPSCLSPGPGVYMEQANAGE
jgi:hypothetical protein